MGCVSSSSTSNGAVDKGGGTAGGGGGNVQNKDNINQQGTGEDMYDKPPMNDPRVPLTRREIFLAGKSWKGISRNLEETGNYMMDQLLKQNPEFENIIKDNVKPEDKENAIGATADSIMNGFSKSILLLEDYDKFTDFLFALGNSYRNFQNFDDSFFEKLRNPFLNAMKETLQDRYTDNIQNIYSKAFDFIVKTMKEGYNSKVK